MLLLQIRFGAIIMADAERLEEIANIACSMIALQLTLSSNEPTTALKDQWCLGYCFGAFDALAQRAKLDEGAEGFGLLTIGFLSLFDFGDHMKAADCVRRALDSQTNPTFQQGAVSGGTEIFTWLADTSKAPNALFEHLTRSESQKRA